MTPDQAIAALNACAQPGKAGAMAVYHKAERPYLGVANPDIDALAKGWRQTLTLAERCTLAEALWDSNIHEARVAAAKLLAQARIKEDAPVWKLISAWVPQLDAWAIADHAMGAAAKRLVAVPARLDQVEHWTQTDHLWTKRAALVATLPWTKQNHPKPAELEARDRVLGWAATYVPDHRWFIQKAVAWWLRELSKHDAPRTAAFLEQHGAGLKPFARREAGKYLTPPSAE